MEISSLLTHGINYSASKTTNMKTGSSDEVSGSTECSEEEKLKAFKQDFWKKIDSMPYNKGIDVSVQITDGAFKRMMKEPKFRDEMTATLMEDARTSNLPPIGTVLTRIDENGYSGYSYCQGGEEAFAAHSSDKDSFYSKKAVKKPDYEAESKKSELERMYQKKMQDKEYYENLTEKKLRDKEYYDNLSEKKLQCQQGYVSKQYEKNINFIHSAK